LIFTVLFGAEAPSHSVKLGFTRTGLDKILHVALVLVVGPMSQLNANRAPGSAERSV
jgi:hypothetical protein